MDEQLPLFPAWPILADSEVMAVLGSAIGRGIHGSREADLCLASTCARHLVDELHSAGLVVVRPSPSRLHE
jgi:hypothetical protein